MSSQMTASAEFRMHNIIFDKIGIRAISLSEPQRVTTTGQGLNNRTIRAMIPEADQNACKTCVLRTDLNAVKKKLINKNGS